MEVKGAVLLDRAHESVALDHALAAIHDGLSSVLVLRGEAGIGKSALLDYAASHASDMQLARVTGVESEMDLSLRSWTRVWRLHRHSAAASRGRYLATCWC